MQKRSANKKYFPNKWALCSGLVISGESCDEAAVRELKEELGVEFQISDLNLLEGNLNLTRFYYVITNYDESQFTIQKEELSSVKWFDLDEVLEKVISGDDSIIIRKDRLYLLEKIRKFTGLDLREFEHAITFKVALMVKKYLNSKPSKF